MYHYLQKFFRAILRRYQNSIENPAIKVAFGMG